MSAKAVATPFERNHTEATLQGDRPDILHRIHSPHVTLALWQRRLPPNVDKWLQSLSPAQLPQGRFLAYRAEFGAALEACFDNVGTPRGRAASHFIADAVSIATLFADIAGIDLVDIGLKVVQHDACWRFHRDLVSLRALTTYLGPGTQVVDASEAERAIKEQKAFRGWVREFPRHSIALFKGAKIALGKGVVHRSPPIAGTGQTRLVLTLNLPSEVSPEYRQLDGARTRGAAA